VEIEIKKTGTLPPEIGENGRRVLEMVAECRKNAKYRYPGDVYDWLGDPIIPDFGDINDIETPCKLVINDYYTPDAAIEDFSVNIKDILFFDKKMAIEALSRVEPMRPIAITGKGSFVHHEGSRLKPETETEVDVLFQITQYAGSVVFAFRAGEIDRTILVAPKFSFCER